MFESNCMHTYVEGARHNNTKFYSAVRLQEVNV